MRNSKISWTDDTLNALRGCSRVSEGCRNCYAEMMTARFSGPGQWGEGLAVMNDGKPRFTGKVTFHPEKLLAAVRTTKPRKYFVNSIADLFHPNVSDDWIDQHFAAFALAPHHIFQILTKRPERMREYMNDPELLERILEIMSEEHDYILVEHMQDAFGYGTDDCSFEYPNEKEIPLPNVWLGVSAENQSTADDRIPHLLNTPAAVRWVSAEPLLGPIKFNEYTLGGIPGISWVVVGGESTQGDKARECDIAWIRDIYDQCRANRVKYFMKQTGSNVKICGSTVAVKGAGKTPKDWPDWIRNARCLLTQEYPQ